jgi:hypothetical protein
MGATYGGRPQRAGGAVMLVVGGLAILVAIAAVAYVAGIFGGDGTADASGSPTPGSTSSASAGATSTAGGTSSAAPTPSPSAPTGDVAVDALARTTVNGLNVRRTPTTTGERLGSLVAGETALVLAGPVSADGTDWVLLGALGLPPNAGCEEPITIDPFSCPDWIGWVAVRSPNDGTAWLERVDWDCPNPADYEQFAALTPVLQLACAGGTSVTVTGWWVGPDPQAGCIDAPPGVDWLFCPWAFGGALGASADQPGLLNLPLTVDPASGVALIEPDRRVTVTGHYDDPAAEGCRVVPGNLGDDIAGAAQELRCRATLVVDSMVEAP